MQPGNCNFRTGAKRGPQSLEETTWVMRLGILGRQNPHLPQDIVLRHPSVCILYNENP